MGIQPDINKFILREIVGDTVNRVSTTPNNWEELEMGLKREDFAINKEVTTSLSFYGEAKTLINNAKNNGYKIYLDYYKLQNDWTYVLFRVFTADMSTYNDDGDSISIGFKESTNKQEIDDNKSTTYDLTLPKDLQLSFTGVKRHSNNIVSATEGSNACSQLSTSNWVVFGNHSSIEENDLLLISSSYNGFHASVLDTITALSVKLYPGTISCNITQPYQLPYLLTGNPNMQLKHCRKKGSGFTVIADLYSDTNPTISQNITGGYIHYNIQFRKNTLYTITFNNGYWTRSSFENNQYISEQLNSSTVQLLEDDFIVLFFSFSCFGARPTTYFTGNDRTYIEYDNDINSNYSAYKFPVVNFEWALNQVLSKMCTVAPTLTYNLPKYDSISDWVPVITSSSGILNQNDPTISLSFEDIMKALKCIYGADYDLTDNVLTVDYAYNFFKDVKSRDVIPISEVSRTIKTDHIYNSVEVGYDTDDDVLNGTLELLCKNTFTVNKEYKKNKLDLILPFKASPYTIEAFLDDKYKSSSTTKESDNDVFLFCVTPFIGVTTTQLYKNQIGIDATYYNVPISPMRILIANGRYIGVSLWNTIKAITFASTDRKADYSTKMGYESSFIGENDGANSTLVANLTNRLFSPEAISFKTSIKIWDMTTINDMLYKYSSLVDEKSGNSYDFFINMLTLQLTRIDSQEYEAYIR